MKNMLIVMVLGLALRTVAEGPAMPVTNGTDAVASSVSPAAAAQPEILTNGIYMIIDISGGSSTSRYAVSYLNAVPEGGWTDAFKTTRMVFRYIPAASNGFLMGSPQEEIGRTVDEIPHAVILTKAFYLGVFPVTQRQWELVMGDRPSYFNNETYYAGRPVDQVSFADVRGASDGALWPETNTVDRSSFMGKMRRKMRSMIFDLPTEAQWEYACRAGTITALNSGYNLTSVDSDQRLDTLGRYWSNSRLFLRQGCAPSAATALVGSYLPNAWGLYDMHGNVWEWCLDWYGPYPSDTVVDPVGPPSGAFRVLRGGSWSYGAAFCRAAYRYYYGSRGTSESLQCHDFGFRVVATIP